MQHHAYYIEGSPALFAAHKEALKPFWSAKYERFGIEEARELIALAGLKNFTEATFFVAASSITSEAQQALLKLLEEPQAGTAFVLLLPHGTLLPTVRSRMLPHPTLGGGDAPAVKEAAEFLKSSAKERSALLAQMLKKDDEEVKERILDFVNALEALLVEGVGRSEVRAGLADIAQVRSYLRDRSPSLKMLLEHLALALPRV